MSSVLVDFPASDPVVEVHIWIGHYATGGEGMISADLPMPGGLGIRHMPLMNSKRDVAEAMVALARCTQSASQHASQRIVRLELRTFRAVTL